MLEHDDVPLIVRNRYKLYEFLSVDDANAVVDTLINGPLIRIHLSYDAEIAYNSDDFFVPKGDDLALPFDNFSLMVDRDGDRIIYTLTKSEVGDFFVQPIRKHDRQVEFGFPISMSVTGNKSLRTGAHCKNIELETLNEVSVAESCQQIAIDFLVPVTYISHATNVYLRNKLNEQPLTAVAVAKSKRPLWEYKLIPVTQWESDSESRGGTHASPRWHMRRGHWRNCKSGKRVWVEQMEVGDKSKGIIVKDYVVTNHLGVSK